MREFNKCFLLYESVLDDVERSEDGRSSGIVASQHQSPKTDWSVYLTLCIGKEANHFEELLPISKQISDFLDSHPAVIEHSKPEIIASDLILSHFKFGCEVCFRSLRQYVKFFYGLLSLIEQIQGHMSKEDFIEVDSDSDPLDGTWKVRRRDAFERLLINAESFDFLDEDTEPILNNLEIYQKRWHLSEQQFVSVQNKLNESMLDDVESREANVSDVQSDMNDDRFYEHQIKVIIASANQFSGKSFNLQERKEYLGDLLDYWEPQIYGHGKIHFDDTKRNENFWFYMSNNAKFNTPHQMERFLKSMMSVCGPEGFQKDRRIYILEWDDDLKEYRYIGKEYNDYEKWCDFHAHYPYKSIEDLCKIYVPLGELFFLAPDRVKKYIKDKFEYDSHACPNPDYKGERFRAIEKGGW